MLRKRMPSFAALFKVPRSRQLGKRCGVPVNASVPRRPGPGAITIRFEPRRNQRGRVVHYIQLSADPRSNVLIAQPVNASIARRMGSGSVGQAATIRANLGSRATLSATLFWLSPRFPGVSGGCSDLRAPRTCALRAVVPHVACAEFDRHTIAPATLTVGPFSKTEVHLHLPAQFFFVRSTARPISLRDSALADT